LINGLLVIMSEHDVDFTGLFRRLPDAARGEPAGVRSLFRDPASLDSWLEAWLARLARGADDVHARATAMDRINPVYIPRNHKVQEALDAATAGDLEPFGRLLDLLARPVERRSGLEEYERRAPDDSAARSDGEHGWTHPLRRRPPNPGLRMNPVLCSAWSPRRPSLKVEQRGERTGGMTIRQGDVSRTNRGCSMTLVVERHGLGPTKPWLG
jgi:hypothetical protein